MRARCKIGRMAATSVVAEQTEEVVVVVFNVALALALAVGFAGGVVVSVAVVLA